MTDKFEVGKKYRNPVRIYGYISLNPHVASQPDEYAYDIYTAIKRTDTTITFSVVLHNGSDGGTIRRKIYTDKVDGEYVFVDRRKNDKLYNFTTANDSAQQEETAPTAQPEQEAHEEKQPEIANSLLNADTFIGKSIDEIKQAFAGKTVKQLKVIALCYLIPYYSSMRKTALIEAIANKIALILEYKHRDIVETVSAPESYNSQQHDFTPEPVKTRSIPDLPAHFPSCEKAKIKFEVGAVYEAQDTGGSRYPIEIISRTAHYIRIKFTYTIGGLWADSVDVKIEGFTEKAICHTTNFRPMFLSAGKKYHNTPTINDHDSQPEQDIPAEHEPDTAPAQTTPEPQPQPQITRFETGKTYIGVFSYKTRYWGESHPHTNHSKSLYTIIARNDKRVTVRSQLRKLDGQYTEGEISQRLIHVTDNGIEYINPEGTYGAYKRYFLLANAPTVEQEDTTPEPQPQSRLEPITPEIVEAEIVNDAPAQDNSRALVPFSNISRQLRIIALWIRLWLALHISSANTITMHTHPKSKRILPEEATSYHGKPRYLTINGLIWNGHDYGNVNFCVSWNYVGWRDREYMYLEPPANSMIGEKGISLPWLYYMIEKDEFFARNCYGKMDDNAVAIIEQAFRTHMHEFYTMPQQEQPAPQPQTPENAPSVRLTSSTPKPQTTRKPRKTASDKNLDHSFIECKDLHGLECSNAMRHNRQLVKAFMFIEPLIAALLTLSKQTIIFLVNDFGCGRLIKGKKKLELVTAFAKELFRRRDYEQSHTPSQPVTPKPTTTTPQTPKQEVKCDKKRQLYFSFEFDEEQSAQEKKVA